MVAIRSKNTTPELLIRHSLFKTGYRYRIHYKSGENADIVFPRQKIAVFINGCFWHHHDCNNSSIPKTNKQFWLHKLNSNVARDKKIHTQLEGSGWKVILVWECEIESDLQRAIRSVTFEVDKRKMI